MTPLVYTKHNQSSMGRMLPSPRETKQNNCLLTGILPDVKRIKGKLFSSPSKILDVCSSDWCRSNAEVTLCIFSGTYDVFRALLKCWTCWVFFICILTEDVERQRDPCQAKALKEAQGAEHGDVDREGHGETEHQHEQHRYDQHRVATKPTERGRHFHHGKQPLKHSSQWESYQSARIPNTRYPKMDPTKRENFAMWTFHAELHTRLHCWDKNNNNNNTCVMSGKHVQRETYFYPKLDRQVTRLMAHHYHFKHRTLE